MRVMLTGAADGIGGATCRLLAQRARAEGQGLRLAMTASGARPPPQALLDEMDAAGARVLFLTGDLSDAGVARDLAQRALDFCGGMDLLVSNAGRTESSPLRDVSVDSWDRMFDLNVRATLILAQTLHGALYTARGAVVAVASMSGVAAHPDRGAYAPAKAALISLVRNLAQEWAADGIRVNAVSPGMIETPASARIYADAAVRDARTALVPLGRIGRPEDVAEAIVYLGSPAASYVTGQNLLIDGGICDSALMHIPSASKPRA